MDDTSDGDGIPTRIHCWTMQLLTTSDNTPRNEDADGAHTKDTLLDYAASDNTPRNEDTDGAHSADPPMDDTAHGSTRRIHCWTLQLPTTHQGMRMQMEHTPRIHCWTMQLLTTHQGMRMQMEHTPRIHQWMTLHCRWEHNMDPLMDEAAMSCELRISYMIYVARFNQIGIFFNSSLKDDATNRAQQGTGCRKRSTPRIHC
ncbi:uncharacterized protein LOC144621203 [Crassostrea virginica]